MLSFTLDQESFAIKSDATTQIEGVLQIKSHEFIAPTWIQIQLVGTEVIRSQTQTMINDTFHLSSKLEDWKTRLFDQDNVYSYQFRLSIVNTIPASFQVFDEQGSLVCGIAYKLQVKVCSMEQTMTRAIHFHRSGRYNNVMDKQEYAIPKRVFWGITKQAKQRWQYELEFASTFDLMVSRTGMVSVRLRYQSHIEVLATTTKLLKNPNKTWNQSCHVEFEFDQLPLPTVINQRLGVEHSIRLTVEFCAGESECMDLRFPVMFTGNSFSKHVPKHATVTNMKRQTSFASLSSSFTDEVSSLDSTIDVPLACCNYTL
ncbi:hypothetical protein INT48_006206 [Thamnidium elegans]|uniref:Uncharacterized protein n=1 Tax=Thamnidium elegans TaxID=101142 RepID=A0A8H7STE9_9FUNG|nr:hypothetical protein INT48_006206 [Thamnidium elegans]